MRMNLAFPPLPSSALRVGADLPRFPNGSQRNIDRRTSNPKVQKLIQAAVQIENLKAPEVTNKLAIIKRWYSNVHRAYLEHYRQIQKTEYSGAKQNAGDFFTQAGNALDAIQRNPDNRAMLIVCGKELKKAAFGLNGLLQAHSR